MDDPRQRRGPGAIEVDAPGPAAKQVFSRRKAASPLSSPPSDRGAGSHGLAPRFVAHQKDERGKYPKRKREGGGIR